jgi:hypothetical protein
MSYHKQQCLVVAFTVLTFAAGMGSDSTSTISRSTIASYARCKRSSLPLMALRGGEDGPTAHSERMRAAEVAAEVRCLLSKEEFLTSQFSKLDRRAYLPPDSEGFPIPDGYDQQLRSLEMEIEDHSKTLLDLSKQVVHSGGIGKEASRRLVELRKLRRIK